MKRIKYVLIVMLILFAASTVQAKIYLDIYGKSFKRLTIGIPPFKGAGINRLKTDFNETLSSDLDASGFFVIAPQSLIDNELASEGVEKQEIKFANWRSIGIELVCKGRFQEQDGALTLEAYLYDTLDGSLMLAKRYKGQAADWKRMTHRLADDIIQAVTGAKGIASASVLFASGNKYHKEIYMADINGDNIKKLTNHRHISLSPSMSPNRRYLAYTSYKEGRPNLYVVDLEKNNSIVYADRTPGVKIATGWINNNTLVCSHTAGRYSTIYIVNVENKEKKVILRGEGISTSPSISPDGRKMVFVSDMHGTPQIFLKDFTTGETKRLTYYGNYNTSPSFSPKGDMIVFVTKTEGAFEICTMNADGTNQRILTEGGLNDSPQFSSCGRYIIYSTDRGGKTNISIMLFNGENKRRLKYTEGNETQPRLLQ